MNRKDVLSWNNVDKAERYIGREGFFGDSPCELLRAVTENKKKRLVSVNDLTLSNLIFKADDSEILHGYFLPADK
jgi:hypothetical protein